MLVILEGIDGAGKSTLGLSLAALTGLPYVDMFSGHEYALGLKGAGERLEDGLPGIGDYAEDFALADFARRTGTSAIVDRGVNSAECYRVLFGKDFWGWGPLGEYWDRIVPPGSVLVHVQRPVEECMAVRPGRFTTEQWHTLESLFAASINNVAVMTRMRVLEFNTPGTANELAEIIEAVNLGR